VADDDPEQFGVEPVNGAEPGAERTGVILMRLGAAGWLLLLSVLVLRPLCEGDPTRNNVYLTVFAPAARAFAEQRELYRGGGSEEFRFPPVAAALLVPFELCGDRLGSSLWRVLNWLVLLLGIRATFRAAFPMAMTRGERAVVLLVCGTAGIGSLNNGQANALILGLLLLATTAVLRGLRARPMAAVSLCAALKVYPLAYGMVLGALRPRLLPALAGFVALAVLLPFALRAPDWVVDQYRVLIHALAQEDRTGDIARAYRDLRLIPAAFGAPMPEAWFQLLQVVCGAAIPALCLLLRWRGAAPMRVVESAFSLTLCWMLLLGPSTEQVTYVLFGPVLAWGLVRAFRARAPAGRALWGSALGLLLLSQIYVDRDTQRSMPWVRIPLPLATLLATGALVARDLAWLRRPVYRGNGAIA
jgi:hypothetical protein